MEKRDFWGGFGLGVAAGLTGIWAANALGRGGDSRIIRLEKSVQIGRPVDEVFEAWTDFPRLAQLSKMIENVQRRGDRWHWVVNVDGQRLEWDAEITQFVPNEAIGWKSVSGPKHSGRIVFSPLGNDTLVHVQMNYAPPVKFLRPFIAPASGRIEGYIEQALRDFKAALERGGRPMRRAEGGTAQHVEERLTGQATGTYGPGPENISPNANARFGAPSVPVEYTTPPEAKR